MVTNKTTELYEIIVQTQGANAQVNSLVKELNTANAALVRTQKTTQSMSKSLAAPRTGMRTMGLAAQNAGYQIQDMAVQIAAGTGVMRAMGQQLPQLFSGFGKWGTVIGTVAAVAGLVVPILLNMNKASRDFNSQFSELYTSIRRVNKALIEQQDPIDDLILKYGNYADAVALARDLLVDTSQGILTDELKEAAKQIDTLVPSVQKYEKQLERLVAARDKLVAQNQAGVLGVSVADIQNANDAIEAFYQTMEDSLGIEINPKSLASLKDIDATLSRIKEKVEAGEFDATYQELLTSLRERLKSEGLLTVELEKQLATLAKASEASSGLTQSELERARAVELASEAMAGMVTESEKAQKKVDELAHLLSLVGTELKGLSAEQIKALEIALAQATSAANGTAFAVGRIADALDSISSENITRSLRTAMVEAEAAALVAGATKEQAKYEAEIVRYRRENAALLGGDREDQIRYAQGLNDMLDDLKRQDAAEATINDQLERRKKLEDELNGKTSARTKRVSDTQKAYEDFIKTLEAFRTPAEAAKDEMRQLEAAYAVFGDQIAENVELQALYDRALAEAAVATSETAQAIQAVSESIATGMGEAFANIITGASSAADAFSVMTEAILADLAKIVAYMVTKKIIGFLFPGFDVAGTIPAPLSAPVVAPAAAIPTASSRGLRTVQPSSLATATNLRTVSSPIGIASGTALAGNAGNNNNAPNVIVNNNAPNTVASATQEDDGRVYVTIEEVRKVVAGDLARGGNSIARSMETAYNVGRGRRA